MLNETFYVIFKHRACLSFESWFLFCFSLMCSNEAFIFSQLFDFDLLCGISNPLALSNCGFWVYSLRSVSSWIMMGLTYVGLARTSSCNLDFLLIFRARTREENFCVENFSLVTQNSPSLSSQSLYRFVVIIFDSVILSHQEFNSWFSRTPACVFERLA